MFTRSTARFALLLAAMALAAAPARAADGFFTVAQDECRWSFYTPAGERFFSTGVGVLDPNGYYCPALGYSPYYNNIMSLYGSVDAWVAVTTQRLQAWGFNTVGGWSNTSLFRAAFPYTLVLNMSGGGDWTAPAPDYWSQDFYDNVASTSAVCAGLADDPQVLGYFIDNEMRWGIDYRRFADLFADYVSFAADAPGKLTLTQWLRDRYYDNVVAFNAVYGLNLASFDDFPDVTSVSPWPTSPQQADDRDAWAGFVADHFADVTSTAIRTLDPNHLVMGLRFISWLTPASVVRATAPYFDVMSVNHYMVWPAFQQLDEQVHEAFRFVAPAPMLEEYYDVGGKPVLISEWGFRGLDAVPPSTFPPNWLFMTAQNQTQRTQWSQSYVQQCLDESYCVGQHWFSYMDEPAQGRYDGENSNFGLVTEEDAPYPEIVAMFTEINQITPTASPCQTQANAPATVRAANP